MPIDFRNLVAGDTGYNNTDAIQPIQNGEAATGPIASRPPQHLRDRTEDIRRAFDFLEQEVSADRSLQVMSDPATTVTWDGSKFTVSDDVILAPIITAGQVTNLQGIPSRLIYSIPSPSGYFSVRSLIDGSPPIYAYNGANQIMLEIYHVNGDGNVGGTPTITTEGSFGSDGVTLDPSYGPVLIRVKLSHHSGAINTMWSQVVSAINADAIAQLWVLASVTGGGPASALAVDVTKQFLWEGTGANVSGSGALDAQASIIPPATFVTFFAGGGSAGLSDGDALVIDFNSAADRLAQSGNSLITASQLRIIHYAALTDPVVASPATSNAGKSFKMHAIPICRRIGTSLFFTNGTLVPTGDTVLFSADSSLRSDLAHQPTTSGTSLIGAPGRAITSFPLYDFTQGTLDSQLGTIQTLLGRLATSAMFVTVGASGCDYTTPQAAVTAIASTGGVVMIKAGTYTGHITFPSSCKSIIFIGQGADTTTIQNSGGNAVIEFGTGDSWHYFTGITFSQPTTTQPIIYALTGTGTLPVVFERCVFARSGNGSMTNSYVESSRPLKFSECSFTGYDHTKDNCFKLVGTADYDSETTVENCFFTNFENIAFSNGGMVEKFIFQNNHITHSGYQPNSSACSILIDFHTYAVRYIDIDGNMWDAGAGTECGGFCSILGVNDGTGAVRVANNILLPSSGMTYGTTSVYMIDYEGPNWGGGTGAIIENNRVWGGLGGGIKSIGALVVGNQIDTNPTASVDVVYLGSGIFENNSIKANNSSSVKAINCVSGGTADLVIRGNRISQIGSGAMTGIYVNDASLRVEISDNIIHVSTSVTSGGITLAAFTSAEVNHNVILNVVNGIYAASGNFKANNNEIVCVGECSAFSISANVSDFVIQGNYISGPGYNATNSTAISLYGNNTNFVIANNIIGGVLYGIENGGVLRYGTISGNTIGADYAGTYRPADRVTFGLFFTDLVLFTSITGNTISGVNADTSTCITFTDPGGANDFHSSIVGNTLAGWDTSGGYGIEFASSSNVKSICVSGNLFYSATHAYHNNAASVGVGGTGAKSMDYNWVP